MAHAGNGIHGGALTGLPICNETAKKLRTDAGLSLAKVGQLVGTGNSAVMYWERGDAKPTGVNRSRYIHVLYVLAGFLLELHGDASYSEARDKLAAELRPVREPTSA